MLSSLISLFVCFAFTICYFNLLDFFNVNHWVGSFILIILDYILYKNTSKFVGFIGEFWV